MLTFKNRLSGKEGLALVELVVAILILAVIILAFTTLFGDSYANIFTAGRKSRALYQAQEELEIKIRTGTAQDNMFAITLPTGTTLPNGSGVLTVPGELVTGDYTYEGKTGTVTTFIPKK